MSVPSQRWRIAGLTLLTLACMACNPLALPYFLMIGPDPKYDPDFKLAAADKRKPVKVVIVVSAPLDIRCGELANVGAGTPGQRANDMLSLDRPTLDWRSIARGHGVEAGQATTLDEFATQLKRGLASLGPYLIEVVL